MGSNLNYPAMNRPGSAAQFPAGGRAQTARRQAVPFAAVQPDAIQGGFRRLAFLASLGMLFIRVSVLSDLLVALIGANTYLLYLVGPPAILGAIFTGGLGRTFRDRAAWLWLGFIACMAISLPFSSWKGGSIGGFRSYLEFSFPLLFTVGGLAVTWKETRAIFNTMALSGLVVLIAARFLARNDNGRVEMTAASLSIGNSNDLASLLVLLLPFFLFVLMDRRRSAFVRYLMIPAMGYGLFTIIGTASRGALIALGCAFLFVLMRASAQQRVAAVAIVLVMAIAVPLVMRGGAVQRLESLTGESTDEAKESQDARSYLLRQSIAYTFQHPIFGVGMQQFSNFEGMSAKSEGRVGNWHETHNAFTQVSSENGIPALIFFVLGIAAAYRSVSRIYKQARLQGNVEIANAAFCYLLALIGYVASIVFLANAYRFYLPAMIGLAIAINATAAPELAASPAAEPVRFGYWPAPRVPARSPRARA